MKLKFLILAVAMCVIGCQADPAKIALREAMYNGTQQIRDNEKTWAGMLVAYPVGTTDPRTGKPSTGQNEANLIPPLTPTQYQNDLAAHNDFDTLVNEDRANDSKSIFGTTQP